MSSTAASPTTARPAWQTELARGFRNPGELVAALDLPPEWAAAAHSGHDEFPTRVPRGFVARMRPGDPTDPLLRQVLPLADEEMRDSHFHTDPVGDLGAMGTPGVLHKYHGRALLIVTGACAVNCRYCFRRHFPYGAAHAARDQWGPALKHVAGDPTLTEIILSGGDPLSLPDHRLAELAGHLGDIPHLQRLRVHTRLPIVLPERVDGGLLDWLAAGRLQPIVVLHANHANELDDSVARACGRLRDAGVTLLNQAVLLRGVNDSVDSQCALSERLFELGVLPYYLHQLDRVAGATHFLVPETEARTLAAALTERLPGYLVPTLAREDAGAPAKTPLITPRHG
ncbi:EF-P beta-lysylation protein EpmB [Aquisalimonas sp. 2447]|uniref:EF-P beta-lysylation protein EpmB n=1 Tax=Aquisalimonas sp. 2447 TaxID=2740807 RepID=UPI001432371D|nr:EF-P beta-lysylation protein EpmB [Aquisalimonas sp. 2447]QIT54605.1 EF-P beta-lysylation protein EpmB [Aquisalimonas sp. 2447]